MGNEAQHPKRTSIWSVLFKNWISLSGTVLAAAAWFAFILLLVIHVLTGDANPYFGILTYLVAPLFFLGGLFLIILGWLIQRRQVGKPLPRFVLDLARSGDRVKLVLFAAGTVAFLLMTAVGSYETYHYTSSVQFCGQACHSVMKPQYVAYDHSPHAKVDCVDCHIGPGADRFLHAKFNGLHQVYAAATDKYPRPLRLSGQIPIDQKTCEQCHWPQRFVGNLDRMFTHFLDDGTNTPYSVRLLLKIGGGDPTHGPVEGIHWHMNIANKVEYIATDPLKQKIPWVRLVQSNGTITEFRTPDFKDDPAKHKIYTMDCMDCHNRPAHHFRSPNDAVDLAMSVGRISTNLPGIKRAAVMALTKEYKTQQEGIEQIARSLETKYAGHPEIAPAVQELQQIFQRYFFPEMKTDWRAYPNNIGHKDWAGCFRCHDDEHTTPDKSRKISGQDCNSCHTILAEGRTTKFDTLAPQGLEFKHPDEGWDALRCHDCHNGSLEPEEDGTAAAAAN